MAKNTLKSFGVWAECRRQVIVTIEAKDLDEAVVKSKTLKDDEFVEVVGEYADGETRIIGVLENLNQLA